MRIAVFILVGLILLSLGGYLYWISTPFYALQQAGIAAVRHDLETFETYIDVPEFVDNLLDDLLVKPAQTTPGLTSLQMETGRETVTLAKATLKDQLINKIRNSISGGNLQEGRYSSFSDFGPDAAVAQVPIAQSKASDLQGIFRAAGTELGHEAGKLKNETYVRLTQCARQQPKTLTGKLLGSPPQVVGFTAKLLIDEYGFTKDNFRGPAGCTSKTDDKGYSRATAGFKFYSPKAGKEITVDIGLYQTSMFGGWRVYCIENIPNLMMQLNEDYEYQVHSLMACTLAGVTERAVNDEVRGLTDRIRKRIDAKGIMEKLKIRFR